MRTFMLLIGGVAILAAITAGPATADTPASFTLTSGSLSISAPTGAVSLGTQLVGNGSSTISGPLGTVTVSDLRGGPTTWSASAIATAFTPVAGPADPASNVGYDAGTISQTALVTATGLIATNLTGVTPVVNGTSTGISSASWNPVISIFLPANLAPGVYSATITHSVA